MVRKTRSQQYVDDETPATQQSVNDLQHQIAALTTRQTAPAPAPQRRHDQLSTHDNSDEEDENPFAPLRQQHQRFQQKNNNESDSDEEHTGSAWKSSFKLEIPEFKGSTTAEELLGL